MDIYIVTRRCPATYGRGGMVAVMSFLSITEWLIPSWTRKDPRSREGREIAEGPDAREEEVGAACQGREGRQADDLPPYGPLRDGEVIAAVLGADERVALVPKLMELWVVDPHVLQEFELTDQARAPDEGGNPRSAPSSGAPSGRCGP